MSTQGDFLNSLVRAIKGEFPVRGEALPFLDRLATVLDLFMYSHDLEPARWIRSNTDSAAVVRDALRVRRIPLKAFVRACPRPGCTTLDLAVKHAQASGTTFLGEPTPKHPNGIPIEELLSQSRKPVSDLG